MIRQAERKDAQRILALLVEVGNVHADLRPDLFIHEKTKYGEQELLAVIEDSNRPIFVYTDDSDTVCGYAFCVLQESSGNNLVSHKSIYIDDICVGEAYRKQHIGKALYEYVLSYAKEVGCYNITLNVWEGNEPARRFYENCGLKPQKTTLEVLL